MSARISRLRDAWNQTLTTHASGQALDDVGRHHGLVRPSYISRAAWRRVLECAHAYRGEPNCTQFALEGALSDFATTVAAILDPSRPSSLYSPAGQFTQDMVGRFVRIPGWGLYRIVGPADIESVFFEALHLEPFGNGHWDGADWSALGSAVQLDVEVLAFDLWENQAGWKRDQVGDTSGTATVYVWRDAYQQPPAAFLVDDDYVGDPDLDPADYPPVEDPDDNPDDTPFDPIALDPAPSDPTTPPFGGILLDESEDYTEGGPFPLYLEGDEIFTELAESLQALLMSGIKLRFKLAPQLVAE